MNWTIPKRQLTVSQLQGELIDRFKTGEVGDLHTAIGKSRDDFQIAAHGADRVAQGADIHIGAIFHFGNSGLIDMQ